jgi:FixJ family two-component response regulator
MTSLAPVIHVVDDDASFRTAVARLLRASGYQVALYESGERLLESPPRGEPGCILLDLRMNGIDGLDLQDRLAKLGYRLPIVFLTGYGDIPASVRAIKAGAEDFLPKPVSKKPLLDAVQRALARHETARVRDEKLAALRALVTTLTPRGVKSSRLSCAAGSTSRSPTNWVRPSGRSRRIATTSCKSCGSGRWPSWY